MTSLSWSARVTENRAEELVLKPVAIDTYNYSMDGVGFGDLSTHLCETPQVGGEHSTINS